VANEASPNPLQRRGLYSTYFLAPSPKERAGVRLSSHKKIGIFVYQATARFSFIREPGCLVKDKIKSKPTVWYVAI